MKVETKFFGLEWHIFTINFLCLIAFIGFCMYLLVIMIMTFPGTAQASRPSFVQAGVKLVEGSRDGRGPFFPYVYIKHVFVLSKCR